MNIFKITPEMPEEAKCNHQYLLHLKEMRMLAIIGFVIGIAAVSLSATLIFLAVSYVMGKITDIGLVISLATAVAGIIAAGMAYLAPSPLQQNSARRNSDGVQPTGTPADPVATKEVADQTEGNQNKDAERQEENNAQQDQTKN